MIRMVIGLYPPPTSWPLLDQRIDPFDEVQLLVEREIAGELVAPVGDLHHGARLDSGLLRIDLDHPDLVRFGVQQFADRWIL